MAPLLRNLADVGRSRNGIAAVLDGMPEKILAARKYRDAALRDANIQIDDGLFRSASCGVVRDAAGIRTRQINTADLQALANKHYQRGASAVHSIDRSARPARPTTTADLAAIHAAYYGSIQE